MLQKNAGLISSIILLSSTQCFAGWPIFRPLSPDTVQQLIVTAHCPPHEGEIPVGSKVRIKSHYIPSDEEWYWYYAGQNTCVELPENLHYVRFYNSGYDAGHFMEIDYGASKQDILFRFIFPITGLWHCNALYPSELPQEFGCARDTIS